MDNEDIIKSATGDASIHNQGDGRPLLVLTMPTAATLTAKTPTETLAPPVSEPWRAP